MTGRPRREQVAQERRRRKPGTLDSNADLKLQVPEELRAKYPDQSFRFINDSDNRIYDKTVRDDWSKVDGFEPIPVGSDKFNKPIYAHLCMKPTEYLREDAAERVKATQEQEKAIMRGQTGAAEGLSSGESYVPEGPDNKPISKITGAFTP